MIIILISILNEEQRLSVIQSLPHQVLLPLKVVKNQRPGLKEKKSTIIFPVTLLLLLLEKTTNKSIVV